MRNMFRVNNKDTSLGTNFTPFSSVSIANFDHVFVCREAIKEEISQQ